MCNNGQIYLLALILNFWWTYYFKFNIIHQVANRLLKVLKPWTLICSCKYMQSCNCRLKFILSTCIVKAISVKFFPENKGKNSWYNQILHSKRIFCSGLGSMMDRHTWPSIHQNSLCQIIMSRSTTRPSKWFVHPAKTLISLGICSVWSECSLYAWRNLMSFASDWAHSKYSDQTGQMPRLIWVFAVCTGHCIGFVMLRLILFSERWSMVWLLLQICENLRKWKHTCFTEISFEELYMHLELNNSEKNCFQTF